MRNPTSASLSPNDSVQVSPDFLKEVTAKVKYGSVAIEDLLTTWLLEILREYPKLKVLVDQEPERIPTSLSMAITYEQLDNGRLRRISTKKTDEV